MEKLLKSLRFILASFGPIIVFYVVLHFKGLKPAVAVSAIFTLCEVIVKRWKREPMTKTFLFTAAMTLGFGCVDLLSKQAFLFKYEACLTNLVTVGLFAVSLRGGRSLFEEVYKEQPGEKPPITPLLQSYLRVLTVIWMIYFLLKVPLYFWMARHYSIERMLVLRTIIGNASMVVMLGITIALSHPMMNILKKRAEARVVA